MGFKKAAAVLGKEIIDEYKLAKLVYSQECKELSRFRMLGDHPAASDAQIVAYAKARKKHKEAYKVYNEARMKFMSRMHSLTHPTTKTSAKDAEYEEFAQDLSLEQLQNLRMREVFEEERKAGQMDHVIDAIKSRASLKKEFTNSAPPELTENTPLVSDTDASGGEDPFAEEHV